MKHKQTFAVIRREIITGGLRPPTKHGYLPQSMCAGSTIFCALQPSRLDNEEFNLMVKLRGGARWFYVMSADFEFFADEKSAMYYVQGLLRHSTFSISINDTFVEYEYTYPITPENSNLSIDNIREGVDKILGVKHIRESRRSDNNVAVNKLINDLETANRLIRLGDETAGEESINEIINELTIIAKRKEGRKP